jgi:hypothetical protein
MSTKMLNKIEKVLKTKANSRNRANAKNRSEYTDNKSYQPIKWTKALALDWQVRNQVFKSTNAFFNPLTMTAISYKWWTFVRLIKGKVVFNDYNYSMTTCKHQNNVKSVMRDLGIKIDLEVATYESLTQFETAVLPVLYNDLFDLEIAAARRNARDRSNEIKEVNNKIKVAKKLGARISSEQIADIQGKCVKNEADRLAKQREKNNENKLLKQNDRKLVETNRVVDLSTLS